MADDRPVLRPHQIEWASLDLDYDVDVIYADRGEIKRMPWREWRRECARAAAEGSTDT